MSTFCNICDDQDVLFLISKQVKIPFKLQFEIYKNVKKELVLIFRISKEWTLGTRHIKDMTGFQLQ